MMRLLKGASLLYLRDLDRVESLRTFRNFKADLVSGAELVEARVLEFVGMEEEILLHAFYPDEPEALVGKTDDCSFFHTSW